MYNQLNNAEKFIKNDLINEIPVYVKFGDQGYNFPDLLKTTQMQTNFFIENVTKKVNIKLIDCLNKNFTKKKNSYVLKIIHNRETFIQIDEYNLETTLFYTTHDIMSNDLPSFMTQTIVDFLLQYELNLLDEEVKKYDFDNEINLFFFFLTKKQHEISLYIILKINNYLKKYLKIFNVKYHFFILNYDSTLKKIQYLNEFYIKSIFMLIICDNEKLNLKNNQKNDIIIIDINSEMYLFKKIYNEIEKKLFVIDRSKVLNLILLSEKKNKSIQLILKIINQLKLEIKKKKTKQLNVEKYKLFFQLINKFYYLFGNDIDQLIYNLNCVLD